MSHFDENNWISKRKTYKNKLTLPYFLEGILQKDKKILSEAITLIESERKSDKDLSNELIDKCLSNSGDSMRIGITGVPGVGKSTFIEAFGLYLISKGKRVSCSCQPWWRNNSEPPIFRRFLPLFFTNRRSKYSTRMADVDRLLCAY